MSNSLRPQYSVACQASLSMEFSRQEYWSRLLFPSLVDFPNPGIKSKSLCIGRQILYRCTTWEDRQLIDAIINYVDTCNKKVLLGEKKKTPDWN